MPWFCGNCTRWNTSDQSFCPTCGRTTKRRCRKCKTPVPKEARFCTNCGGSDITEAANTHFPISRRVRVAAASAGVVLIWGTLQLLSGPFVAACEWTANFTAKLGVLVLFFWVLTAGLPNGMRQAVRRGTWRVVSGLARFVGNLFR